MFPKTDFWITKCQIPWPISFSKKIEGTYYCTIILGKLIFILQSFIWICLGILCVPVRIGYAHTWVHMGVKATRQPPMSLLRHYPHFLFKTGFHWSPSRLGWLASYSRLCLPALGLQNAIAFILSPVLSAYHISEFFYGCCYCCCCCCCCFGLQPWKTWNLLCCLVSNTQQSSCVSWVLTLVLCHHLESL